ncbi:hypothetical protein Phou_061780 [Phytohabitans houttuyneae]|uniref:Uncharacterized protein n=1 Tax=Phytohabitans houttuyneae TaxID=1076126 RepID=A0A6V8KHW9_9ACTN|nr:hypothetical protein Phou_061780 [Phytohabitans houttuyneae]
MVWLAAIAIRGAKIATPAMKVAITTPSTTARRRTGRDGFLSSRRTAPRRSGKLVSDMRTLLI